jgi:hypothetical protein
VDGLHLDLRDGRVDILVWADGRLWFFHSDPGSASGFAPPLVIEHEVGELLSCANLLPDGRRAVLVRLGAPHQPRQLAAFALTPTGGALEKAWDGPSDPLGNGQGKAAAADLDGDGLDEVFVDSGGLALVTATPAPTVHPLDVWFPTRYPALADLDGDRRPELLVDGAVLKLSEAGLPDLGRRLTARGADAATWSGEHLALGDFSGDDLVDLAVVDSAAAKVWLTRQSSEQPGELEPDEHALAASAYVELGDLNGDRRADAITPGSAGSLAYLDLDNDAPEPVCSTQPDLAPLAIADVTGDARPDVVVSGTNAVLLFDAPGFSCSEPRMVMPYGNNRARPSSIRVADMNRDGMADVVVVSDAVRIALQRPEAPGTFEVNDYEFQAAVGSDRTYWDGKLADIDRDGLPDVIVLGRYNEIRIFINSLLVPGTLEPSVTVEDSYKTGKGGVSLGLGEIQGTGLVDIVAFDLHSAHVFHQQVSPAGTFEYAYSVAGAPGRLGGGSSYLIDLDGDGKLDIVHSDAVNGTMLLKGR